MRLSLIPLALLAAACSREPAPSQPAAASAPAPAVVMPGKSDPGVAAAARVAPRNDSRLREVDPSGIADAPAEVAGGEESNPELSRFEDDQSRHDAELMAQDAEEAQRQLDRREAPREDRYARDDRYHDDERIAGDGRDWRNTERYRRYAEQRERYRGQRRDPRYADENSYPPEELDPYAQPEPWDEVPEGPEADEDYDPESGEYYQR